MGREGPFFNEERKEFERKNSKDKVKNTEGTKLIEMVEENGWEILNGNTKGDEAGEFTRIGGKGNSVIDYIMIDPLMKDKIKSFRIEDRVESPTNGNGSIWENREGKKERRAMEGEKSVDGREKETLPGGGSENGFRERETKRVNGRDDERDQKGNP